MRCPTCKAFCKLVRRVRPGTNVVRCHRHGEMTLSNKPQWRTVGCTWR